ncbi:reverse transcriptase domain-containing protein [Tanacetum coccineum]
MMVDNRTMAQLLEAPTEGYEDDIVVPEITADNFELKHSLLTLVQNKQFFGHDKEDPHAHIHYFTKITSTMKFSNVPSTSVKLMLFPFSLEGAARIWLEKEPPRLILTWDDLVSKFINKFFPPSKTTNLRNEITRFQQRFDETFYEAWDRFNDLLRACPHHGFSELHQLDTSYNALNSNDQDSLNFAAGGNFLDKMPCDCLRIIKSKSKVRNSHNKLVVAKVSTSNSTLGISPDVAELKDMVKALLLDKKNQSQAPATVKAVEESCVTCGGAHSYQNCPATDGNVYRDNIQVYVSEPPRLILIKEIPVTEPRFLIKFDLPVFLQFNKTKEIINTVTIKTGGIITTKAKFIDLRLINLQFIKLYLTKLRLRKHKVSGTLPSNFPYSPKVRLEGYTEPPTNNGSTKDVQPTGCHVHPTITISEPLLLPMDECLALANLGASINLMPLSMWKNLSLQELTPTELTIRVRKEAVTFNLDQTLRYSSNYDDNSVNRINVIDMDCEEYSQEVLSFSDVIASGNPTPYYDPIVSTSSPTLTPFGDSDFLLEEVDAFLALEDDPTSPEVDHSYYDQEGDILLLEAFLNDESSLPPPTQGN